MRLCCIADTTSVHTQRWANHFASRGHEVHVVSRRLAENHDELDTAVQVHPLIRLVPCRQVSPIALYLSALPWVLQVRTLVRRINADILCAHFIGVPGYLGAAAGFHPLVVTVRGSDILVLPKRNPMYRFLTKQTLKRADTIICVSTLLGEETTRLGAWPGKIQIVPAGVDTEEFGPAIRDEGLLRSLNIDDSPVIISTRNLKPVYDVQTLIKAMPVVLAETPDAKLVIAGAGEQRSYLEELARDLGVSHSARFVGWVPRSRLPDYLSLADVYVSSSLSDGTSNSLLEGMACALAPVVTDIPANRPWITDGHNGFLFPVRDHRALAARIISLLKDRETRENFGRRSRDKVRREAEEETQMARLEQMYDDLVQARPTWMIS